MATPNGRDLEPTDPPSQSSPPLHGRSRVGWLAWCRMVDAFSWAILLLLLGLLAALIWGCAGPAGAALDDRAESAGRELQAAAAALAEAEAAMAQPEELEQLELALAAARAELLGVIADRPAAIVGDTERALWSWLELLIVGTAPAAGLYALRNRTRRRWLEERDQRLGALEDRLGQLEGTTAL